MSSTFLNLPIFIEGGPGTVDSFNGRTGTVVSQPGDYSGTQVSYNNATSGLVATNVQDAIDEVVTLMEAPVSLEYEAVNAVASGALTNILSYTASTAVRLMQVDVAGTNIAEYTVVLNGVVIDKKYTMFGAPLTAVFGFSSGIQLAIGDDIDIRVIHDRPALGNFNARILVR